MLPSVARSLMARNTDHDYSLNADRVEETARLGLRQLGAHSRHDGDKLVSPKSSGANPEVANLGLVERQLPDQGAQFHRHGAYEGDHARLSGIVHPRKPGASGPRSQVLRSWSG